MSAGSEFKEYLRTLSSQVYLKESLLLPVNDMKNQEKQGEDEVHLICFIQLATSITAGDVFDDERNNKGKMGAFSFCSRIR